ncbi:MAG: bifunctional 5,10-methylenetetrahydrofolate dehydrogenase/5,10-methenyltetrahydrofolate cyclohydrolase [Patescibacteria group bacterium]|nr:bifunctional 5,10-methylenetetrahydrofolate dehydrogenase/5,10-methenyltetrahydrofolate cyclohydrolase [Patescibacteria group bacterium]
MIIDGKALAKERSEEIMEARGAYGALSLGVVIATESAVTQSYIGIKKRAAARLDISVSEYRLPESAGTDEIVGEVKKAGTAGHDGIILQLPLPSSADVEAAKNAIPKDVDVDVLSDSAFSAFEKNAFPALPQVPAAMWYILKRHGIEIAGKEVVIIGKGRLVGKPAMVLFERLGGTVTALEKGDSLEPTKKADILISGAGVPSLITPDMIKDGVVIVDGGTSESGGVVVGDAHPACSQKASLFTPVPGGVGPIAVVEIFANLVSLKAKRA